MTKQYDFSDFDEPKKDYDFSDFDGPEKASVAKSALGGFAEGATLGFADELVGGVGAVADYISQGGKLDLEDYYKIRRDLTRKDQEKSREDNPGAYLTGNVAGAVTSSLAPGLGALNAGKGAGLATQVGKGALQGGLTGAGMSEADSLGDLAVDTATGAAIGGAMPVAVKGLGKVASKVDDVLGVSEKISHIPDWLKGMANSRAVKSLDPILSQQSRMDNLGITDDLGRELLDEKIVRFGSSVKGMAPKVEDLLQAKGQRIGQIRQLADEAGANVDISGLTRKGDMMAALSNSSAKGVKAVASEYSDEIASLAGNPNRNVSQLQEQIADINGLIPFEKDPGKLTANQTALTELRGDLVGKMDDAIGETVPEHLDEYTKLKSQFHLFKEGEKVLDKSVSRGARNRDFSLTDYLVATRGKGQGEAGASYKDIAFAFGNKLLREHGNSMAAVGADKLADIVRATPQAFGKYSTVLSQAAARGGNSLAVTNFMLQQQDPEYRETLRKATSGE